MKVELICPIDWEQRKYELAKAAMQGIISSHKESFPSKSEEVNTAITYADLMIKQLKESEELNERNKI